MDSHSSFVARRYCYSPTLYWNPQVEEYFTKAYGTDHFARISEALTHPSRYSCIRVNILKSTIEDVIEKLTNLLQDATVDDFDLSVAKHVSEGNTGSDDLRKENVNFICNLSPEEAPKYGIKSMERLKYPSICKCPFPGLDYVIFVKGSGPHKIHYDHPSQLVKEVIVSRKCAEAVLRGAQIFVPGLLACSSHVEKGDIVAVSAAVEQPSADGGWGISMTRGTVLHGSHTDPQYFERNDMYIGQGITQFSRAGMFRASEGVAVEMINRVYSLPSFHSLLEGEIFLQNLPSIVVAHVLDPQQGERILDMCAAPGGKTTAIAMLMRDKGEVVAVDRSHNKVMDIKKLAAEMELTCIRAYRLDALKSVHKNNEAADVEATKMVHENLYNTVKKASPSFDNSDLHFANTDRGTINAKFMSNGKIDF